MKIKNIIKYVCGFLFIGAGLTACEKNDIMTYEDVSRIYFAYADDRDDQAIGSSTINMGYDVPVKDDSIVKIPIKLMGRVSEMMREAKVKILPDESTAIEGEDIEIVSALLDANSNMGEVAVKLKHTKRTDKETLMARICLVSNENFHTDFTEVYRNPNNDRSGLVYTIYFTALADKPSLWAGSSSAMRMKQFFGDYSVAKINMICAACGVSRDYFEIDPADDDPSGMATASKRFPNEIVFSMISMCNRYLAAYKEIHGEPMYDEFGKEMKVGLSIM